MGTFSLWHWIVIVACLVLLFGRGRISRLMGDVGTGIRSFRREISETRQSLDSDPSRPAD
jgi:sec-independent protein translocase protein TatA